MEYEIVELEDYSGSESTIYSIIPKGKEETLFDVFIREHFFKYNKDVKNIAERLEQIGKTVGAREGFFKTYEGKLGDGVCALYDTPEKNLRLYCIRYGLIAIIIGGGGPKPKGVKAWQDDPKLKNEVEKMIKYAKHINDRISEGDLYWGNNSIELNGNLKNYEDE